MVITNTYNIHDVLVVVVVQSTSIPTKKPKYKSERQTPQNGKMHNGYQPKQKNIEMHKHTHTHTHTPHTQ